MAKRLLVVSSDPLERQALVSELRGHFDVLSASGNEQALGVLEKTDDLAGVISHWGAMASGPELMRAVQRRRPALVRVLLVDSHRAEQGQQLVETGAVRLLISTPWAQGVPAAAVTRAVGAGTRTAALRSEPRQNLRLLLSVSAQAWEGFTFLWTKDVSSGGAFFLYAEVAASLFGSSCGVKLGSAIAPAQVAHVVTASMATANGSEPGFGVSFLQPQPAEWWTPRRPTASSPAAAAVASPGTNVPVAPLPPPRSATEIESGKVFYALGMTQLAARDYLAARQNFELAIRYLPPGPHQAMPLVCNGLQLCRLGQMDQAQQALERALLLSPGCVEALDGLEELDRLRTLAFDARLK